MRRLLAVLTLVFVSAGSAQAHGILIPEEKKLPPLAMLNHQVTIAIDDQAAVTTVEQVFRNHTDRELEATYLFPVPKGAGVRKFSMWVGGKEVEGELVEADKARKIYTDIVQRTQDPGLLEYLGSNLLQVKVFPVPAHGDLKIKLSYMSLAQSDHGLIEYVYPLKTDGKATRTLEKFGITAHLKSQHTIQNIYSPSHSITMTRPNDREAVVTFEKDQAVLDKDFQLYYTAGGKDVGLTALTHRPVGDSEGYFMILASPRAELSKDQQVPRDMVFVLDTSGSMRGKRMTQAQNALKYCLKNLGPNDRFALMNFATVVNKYTEHLLPASADELARATKWVDKLRATGGTAIDAALAAALALRSDDASRTFNIVFFTDGQPTIGETNPEVILKNFEKKNAAGTRVFTFGVGDDVNAVLLDQLAEQTRAVATYVRESEDIEARVSSLYAKISNPVLTNLKLSVSPGVILSEVYPPQLPDLFHGSQLVVLGRFQGQGPGAVKLTGNVGKDVREFVYELKFPEKTDDAKEFVEDLWARRKVGFLLDQIRANGEKKELIEEVTALAKRYGIATPYTSYLIVPDAPVPVAGGKAPVGGPAFAPPAPVALQGGGGGGFGGGKQKKVTDFVQGIGGDKGEKDGKDGAALERRKFEEDRLRAGVPAAPGGVMPAAEVKALADARIQLETFDKARELFGKRDVNGYQAGQFGVDLALQTTNLRNQTQLGNNAVRRANQRNCLEVGGVWIDEGFDPKMKTVAIKAMSEAYFQLLTKQPKMREVFQLGNHVVWVTPSGTALVIDTTDGAERMSEADLDRLFVPAKK